MTSIAFIIPTRDRPQRLKETLLRLGSLCPPARNSAHVYVIDNASRERAILPRVLDNAWPVSTINLERNEGAAARNAGARAAHGADWLVMLDDDSYPIDERVFDVLSQQPPDVAAVSADIFLPRAAGEHDIMPREAGGLPEVFIGCGVAIRRDAFLASGGYDPAFNYYVEEYDLAARLLLAGYRVAFDQRFVVHHAKDAANRDMDLILARLVRNNGWVAQRYAPDQQRAAELREIRRRYRAIAAKEDAVRGYGAGLVELRHTLRAQPRRPMSRELFDRFTGLAAAREALSNAHAQRPFRSAAIVDAGKNAWVVEAALRELGVRLCDFGQDADVQVVGTMSPGPMLDAFRRRASQRRGRGPRVLMPWIVEQSRVVAEHPRADAA